MVTAIAIGAGMWALIWGGICAAIWAAKGGDGLLAFVAGCLLGIFAVFYFAFATPRPPRPRPDGPDDPRRLPPWRDRRIGAAGWAAVGACVGLITVLLLTAYTPK